MLIEFRFDENIRGTSMWRMEKIMEFVNRFIGP